jgi:segregation and condensation protein A
LQVFLEAFEGPLDLLLYLIRRQNLDILDIPIAEITRQYMKYIDVMSELQLELAGEYLLMAAMLAEIKSRMLLPRPPSAEGGDEEDPRAELVRRLQEYERFKQAAEDIDRLPRMERDTLPTSAELTERKVVKIVPQVTLQEMLVALKDVMSRAEMFAHHHVHRDRLSVRQRMSDILSSLRESAFVDFTRLFRAEEGRMGVTVTFSAILELMKEGLIEIVQAEPYAPLHVRPASGSRHLKVVSDSDVPEELADADAQNQAALAQPALPDENVVDDEDVHDLLAQEDPAASVAVGDDAAAADVENQAALAQPALPDEDVLDDEDFDEAFDEEAPVNEADEEHRAALAQPELPDDDSTTAEPEAASEPVIDDLPVEDVAVGDSGSHGADSVTGAPVDEENRERTDETDQK